MDHRRKWREIVNGFETWCWGSMLKIKWTDRITNGEVFQRAKEERYGIVTFLCKLML
jgi:hypothetical protein